MQLQQSTVSTKLRPDVCSSTAAADADTRSPTEAAVSTPSADAANNGKDVDHVQQQEEHAEHADQRGVGDQQEPALASAAAGQKAAKLASHLDILAAGQGLLEAAGLAVDSADADRHEQQAKRRKVDSADAPAQQDIAPAGPDADVIDDDDLLPDLSMIEALAAQVSALSKKVDSAKAAVLPRPAAVSRAGGMGASSGSPMQAPMQVQHTSMDSSALKAEATAADGAIAVAAALHGNSVVVPADLPSGMFKQHDDVQSTYARLRAKADQEAARAAAEAKRAAAAADAAAAAFTAHGNRQQLSSSFAGKQHGRGPARADADMGDISGEDEQMRGVPGYVPKWLREWRPKARAAAAAARAKQQHRKAAAAAAAVAAHRSSHFPPFIHPQHTPVFGAFSNIQVHTAHPLSRHHSDDGQQHHKHLGMLLDALNGPNSSPGRSQPGLTAPSPPAAAGAPATAAGAKGDEEGKDLGVPSFVFKADMLPPPQEGSQRSSMDGSGPESPDAVMPGTLANGMVRLLSSSAEPELPAAAAAAADGVQPQQQQQQQQQQKEKRSREGSANGSSIFALPKREWQKLSAAAGLHAMMQKQQQTQAEMEAQHQKYLQQQALQAQIKIGCTNAHLARAVQAYRGVFAVEGTTLYEVRMYRSKLGKVLRLKNHSDAVAAARAFDRAALCLARASMSSKFPELNFPAADYEGESLPDLRGKGPAEIREVLEKAFSGSAPPTYSLHRQSSSQIPGGWQNGDSSSALPAPQPQQLQKWLPQGFTAAAEGSEEPAEGLEWGNRRSSSPLSPTKAAHTGAAMAAAGPAAGQQRLQAPTAVLREVQQFRQPHQQAVPHNARQPMHMDAPGVPVQQQPPTQQQTGEHAMLSKMLGDLQSMSRYCSRVQSCLRQFKHELTKDPAAVEAAAVAGPTAREEVRSTLSAVEACQAQEAALQTLLTDTMQLLQPALSDEERQRLQHNSVQLAPALEALSTTLSDVCRAVLRAAVTQDAAACAAAAVAAGAAGNPAASAAAGALAAASQSGLAALQQAVAPSLDKIPAGSTRATRMVRLSTAIRSGQESMASAKKVLSGQE